MIASLRALSARLKTFSQELRMDATGEERMRPDRMRLLADTLDDLDAAIAAAPESAAPKVYRVCSCGYTMAPITGGWVCTHCGNVDQHPSVTGAVQEKEP